MNRFFQKALRLALLLTAYEVCWAQEEASLQTFEGFPSDRIAIESHVGWTYSTLGVGVISRAHSANGAHSLGITPAVDGAVVYTYRFAGAVTFTDFWYRPSVSLSSDPIAAIDVAGALIGFLKQEGRSAAELHIVSETGEAAATGYFVALADHGDASDWIRLTFRHDGVRKIFDLAVNGELLAVNQPIQSSTPRENIIFYPVPDGISYVDDLSVTTVNPLFVDRDGDNIPDAYEVAMGMSDRRDDRDADRDLDGVPNIVDFLNWSTGFNLSPGQRTAGEKRTRTYVFVDAQIGNDTFTGRFPTRSAHDGPKASIRAALDSLPAGGVIIVSEGRYPGSDIDVTGQDVVIKTVGDVKLN